MELMEEIHPIAKTPLYVVYPYLRPLKNALQCLPWMQYEELHNSEHEMNDLLDGNAERTVTINGRKVLKKHASKQKQHKNDKAAENPLSTLGYGIVAYVDILYTMIWVFVLFSLLMFPTLQNYQKGLGYEDDAMVGKANGMLGNLGYSSVECRNIPVSLGNIAITCQYGTVGKIFEFGVNNPDSGSPIDACVNNDENSSCKPTNNRIKSLLDQSQGKERYTVNFD